MNARKSMAFGSLLLGISLLALLIMLSSTDVLQVFQAVTQVKLEALIIAVVLGLVYVFFEGIILSYLFRRQDQKVGFFRASKWASVGFFFSSITPSATGGQPAQLYYMRQDDISTAKSSTILIGTAVLNKLAMAFIGLIVLLCAYPLVISFLGTYLWLYYVGLICHVGFAGFLVFLLMYPQPAEKGIIACEKSLIRLRILKKSPDRKKKISHFFVEYQRASSCLSSDKTGMFFAFLMSLAQRTVLFLIPGVLCWGFGSGIHVLDLFLLQASVALAVEMTPIPGAAGISELVSSVALLHFFTGNELIAVILVLRLVSFYLPLIVSSLVVICGYVKHAYTSGIKGRMEMIKVEASSSNRKRIARTYFNSSIK